AIWVVLLLAMLTLGLSGVLNPLISGVPEAEVGWLSFFFAGLLGTMLASLLQCKIGGSASWSVRSVNSIYCLLPSIRHWVRENASLADEPTSRRADEPTSRRADVTR